MYVDCEDLRRILKKMESNLVGHTEVENLFRRYDSNEDGKLSYSEYAALMFDTICAKQ